MERHTKRIRITVNGGLHVSTVCLELLDDDNEVIEYLVQPQVNADYDLVTDWLGPHALEYLQELPKQRSLPFE